MSPNPKENRPAPLLSVVLPAHDEAPNVQPVHHALHQALDPLQISYEIIFVDDGSRDATAARVLDLARRDSRVRLVRLTRNFGHQIALWAGLECARGRAVVTMDCDLEHHPSELPRMLAAWQDGALVVQMVRQEPPQMGRCKRWCSHLFYRLINRLSQVPVQPGAADFLLLDRLVVDTLLTVRDRRPFLRGLVSWLGYPTTTLTYQQGIRTRGRPGYSPAKSLALAVDAITGLSSQPLRWSFVLGMVLALVALAYIVEVFFEWLMGGTVRGWATLMVVILGLGAVQLILLGVLGEYVGRIFEQGLHRPLYVLYPQAKTHPEEKDPGGKPVSSQEEKMAHPANEEPAVPCDRRPARCPGQRDDISPSRPGK